MSRNDGVDRLDCFDCRLTMTDLPKANLRNYATIGKFSIKDTILPFFNVSNYRT